MIALGLMLAMQVITADRPLYVSPTVVHMDNGGMYLHCPAGYGLSGTSPQMCELSEYMAWKDSHPQPVHYTAKPQKGGKK
jgi:hypothetical protein